MPVSVLVSHFLLFSVFIIRLGGKKKSFRLCLPGALEPPHSVQQSMPLLHRLSLIQQTAELGFLLREVGLAACLCVSPTATESLDSRDFHSLLFIAASMSLFLLSLLFRLFFLPSLSFFLSRCLLVLLPRSLCLLG